MTFHDKVKKIKSTDEIIFVDDNRDEITIMNKCFQRAGLKNPLMTFESGTDFLNYMKKIKIENLKIPDLVLLDVRMPIVDGFAVLRALKSDPVFSEIPQVILFTSSDAPSDISQARELGANGFKAKPIGITAYVQFLKSLLE